MANRDKNGNQDTAQRISEVLRKRKRSRKLSQKTREALLLTALVTALAFVALLAAKNWSLIENIRISQPIATLDGDNIANKIGGAVDILTGSTAQYAPFADGMAVVNTSSLRYATEDGSEGYYRELELIQPALCIGGKYLLAYDRSGTALHLANKEGIIGSVDGVGKLVDATVSNGGTVLALSECEGYKSAAAVYDKHLKRIYLWKTPDYYTLSGAVLGNEKGFAVSALETKQDQAESVLLLFQTDKEGIVEKLSFGAVPIIRVWADSTGYGVLTDGGVFRVDLNGKMTRTVDFAGASLCGAYQDGLGGLFVMVGPVDTHTRYRVYHLGSNASAAAETLIAQDVHAMAAANGRLALLTGSGVRLYDSRLNMNKVISYQMGVHRIVLLNNQKVVMMTEQSILLG